MEEKVWYQKLSEQAKEKIKLRVDYDDLVKKESIKILDFGCGNGRYTYLFKELFPNAEIHAVDINEENINSIKQDFEHTCILNPDKVDLDYENDFFDLIFAADVIEHIPNELYHKYLHKLKDILKPACAFIFGTPNYPYKRLYDMSKAFKALLKGKKAEFKYYLFDDPTHINPLNYKRLEKDFCMFSSLELKPTKIFLGSIIQNKKFSDKIMGKAVN